MDEIAHSKSRWMPMAQRLLLMGLCLFASPSLWADKGHVTITNCGTEEVWIGSYDWGDTLPEIAYESSDFSAGDEHTLHCVKNWFTKDSPGCQIGVKTGDSGPNFAALWKVDNGTYTLGSVNEKTSCTSTTALCLKQQQACSSDSSANNTDCLKTAKSSYDNLHCTTTD